MHPAHARARTVVVGHGTEDFAMPMITPGGPAPDFELPTQMRNEAGRPGRTVRLSELRGAPVVLAFYPLDFSPTCSTENTCFRDDLGAFEGAGAKVLGISVDSVWAHAAFADQLGISYPLLADFHPKGAVASKFGLYNEERGISKRATVIIDKDGNVVWAKEHPSSEARSNAEILEVLKGL